MNFVCRRPHRLYEDELREGKVHIVAFAEAGFSIFRAYLEFSFGFDAYEGVDLCNKINNSDETGTIWPRGNLTALPSRFFREPLLDSYSLKRCLRNAFRINRDDCKCPILVFDFTCNVINQNELLQLIEELYASEFDCLPLSKVIVHFDEKKDSFYSCIDGTTNPYLVILRRANELNWVVSLQVTCGCLNCTGFDQEIKLLAENSLLVDSLARIDVGKLYNYRDWANAIRIALGYVHESSKMGQILTAWLPQLHKNINLADIVLFYFIRRSAPMDGFTRSKWIDSCVSLAIETENESLLESLIYTLPPKFIKDNPALNSAVLKNSIWSKKISRALSRTLILNLH